MNYSLGDSELAALQTLLSSVDKNYEFQSAPVIRTIIQNCIATGLITSAQRKRLLLLLSLPIDHRDDSENSSFCDLDPFYIDRFNDDAPANPTQRLFEGNECAQVFRQQAIYYKRTVPRDAVSLYMLPHITVGRHHAKKHYFLKGTIGVMASQQGKDFRASLKANVNHKQAQQAAQSKAKKNSGGEQRERSRGGQGRTR